MTLIPHTSRLALLALASAFALSACTMTPRYQAPNLPVSNAWPVTPAAEAGPRADSLPWRQVFLDARLQSVIGRALDNNRDLRVAVLNIEKARAGYRMTRSNLLPTVNGTLSENSSHTPRSISAVTDQSLGIPSSDVMSYNSDTYNASLGVSYELDLFGRARSLSGAAFENYLAVAENRRAVQIALISETASAWLTLAADQDLLRLAQETLRTREESFKLAQRKFDLGATSESDLRNFELLTEQARDDVARFEAQVNQDKNALVLLTGADVPAADLPDSLPAEGALLAAIPSGLPSDVLTGRPDVLAAEHGIKAANGDIGAARAAFFPSISLTGATGSTSTALDELFKAGTGSWNFAPSINLPIFSGGYNRANLKAAEVSRDIAVAGYEKTVQTAFREVSDALAVRATIDRRLTSGENAARAAEISRKLAQARYDSGVDSYLQLLDAERNAYGAQQALIGVQLARGVNLVTLYKVMGGGLAGEAVQ